MEWEVLKVLFMAKSMQLNGEIEKRIMLTLYMACNGIARMRLDWP